MEGGEGFNPNLGNIENKGVDWKQRESVKKQKLQERYTSFNQKQKDTFVRSQQEVVGLFGKLVNSDQEIPNLLPEEAALLEKTRNFVKKQKELRPGEPINVAGFAKEEDKMIHENLIGRWAMARMENSDKKNDKDFKINENKELKGRNIDSKKVVLHQTSNKVQIKYDGVNWYSVDGELLANTSLKILLNKSKNAPYASFEPIKDAYTISSEAIHDLVVDKDNFLTAMMHEIGHDNYLSLTESQQKDLNDLFINDPGMKQNFMDFLQALYGDKQIINSGGLTAGEAYLNAHDVDILENHNNLLASEGQKGLKDKRSMEIQINGQKRRVFIGAATTEFLSYMSAYEVNENAFDKAKTKANLRRGEIDQRYEVVKRTKEYLDANQNVKDKISGYKIFDKEKLNKIYNLVNVKERGFLLVDD